MQDGLDRMDIGALLNGGAARMNQNPWLSLQGQGAPPAGNVATATQITGPGAGQPVGTQSKQVQNAQLAPEEVKPVQVASPTAQPVASHNDKKALKDDLIAFLLSAGLGAVSGGNPIQSGLGALSTMGQLRMAEEETNYKRGREGSKDVQDAAKVQSGLNVDAAQINAAGATRAEALARIREIQNNSGLTRQQKVAEIQKIQQETRTGAANENYLNARANDPDLATVNSRMAHELTPDKVISLAQQSVANSRDIYGQPTKTIEQAMQEITSAWPKAQQMVANNGQAPAGTPAPTPTVQPSATGGLEAQAKAAISSGKDPVAVRARYKSLTGKELPP